MALVIDVTQKNLCPFQKATQHMGAATLIQSERSAMSVQGW